MKNKDFADKFNCSLDIAKRIIDKEPIKTKIASFNVYNESDTWDQEQTKMNEFLKNHPNCEKIPFHQQGPCSNWGYDIYRLETIEEYNKRIKSTIKMYKKILNGATYKKYVKPNPYEKHPASS